MMYLFDSQYTKLIVKLYNILVLGVPENKANGNAAWDDDVITCSGSGKAIDICQQTKPFPLSS